MYADIVFPDGNEAGFLRMASALGYSRLIFVYPMNRLPKMLPEKGSFGVLADAKSLAKAMQLSDFVLFRGSDRAAFERAASLVFELEGIPSRDFMHSRNSGFNHVLAAIARERGVAVGFSFSLLLNAGHPAQLFGRMRQNIRLCRKYKVRMRIGSFAKSPFEMRAPNDLHALFCLLGMHPKEAGDALRA